MSLEDRQRQLVESYSFIEDPMERFQVIVDSAANFSEKYPEKYRREDFLVPGCTSQVWLAAVKGEGGELEVYIDSDAPALKGIAKLMVELYSGAQADEVTALEPNWLEALQIDRNLSPTRLRGLENIHKQLLDFARGARTVEP